MSFCKRASQSPLSHHQQQHQPRLCSSQAWLLLANKPTRPAKWKKLRWSQPRALSTTSRKRQSSDTSQTPTSPNRPFHSAKSRPHRQMATTRQTVATDRTEPTAHTHLLLLLLQSPRAVKVQQMSESLKPNQVFHYYYSLKSA